nr:kinesin-like protein NACK1 [Ipomoea batatas]
MSSVCGDEGFPPQLNDQGSSAHEEKIYVSIRVRPLNDREISRNDVADWECIDSTTILFKNAQGERSSLPTTYQFDRVFGRESSTREVYDEAAKRVVLSVLSGMNASIFAYGQTSSGKTYTMSGVTEYAMQDIFDYIEKRSDRRFVLKFSAIEIYNEVVRDLLSTDNTPLRLLDDPERGTVVEKLSEVMPRDQSHLSELLSICEAQRQIGETSLNGMSSRSHQILRLTIESSATQSHSRNNNTLSAAVNFIDLAGSERASQTLSAGTRLKEGCHINRSLLSLGTVIRKLSKGRNGHVPYRDSKLTRILQHSLGGNARTAIICTMSPAHTHVEQSRNTLLFATCAKQVATKARVNVVMSDKALVKQLQKELARLESELRALRLRSMDENSALVLKEKEVVIEKMEKDMRDLMMQRDIAQSRMQNLLRSRPWGEMSYNSETSEYASEASATPFKMDAAARMSSFSDRFEAVTEACDDSFLSDDTSPRHFIDKYFGPDPSKDWHIATHKSSQSFTDSCSREVQFVEMESTAGSIDFTVDSSEYGDYQDDIETMGYSPFSETGVSCSSNMQKTRSCKSLLAVVHGKQENGLASRKLGKQFSGKLIGSDKKVTRSRAASDSGMVLATGFNRGAANDESSDVKGHNVKVSMDAGFNSAANDESFNVKGHNVMVSMNIGFNSAANDESSDVKGHNVKVSMDTGFISPTNDESSDVKGHKFKVSMDAGFNSLVNDESSDVKGHNVKVSMDAGFNSDANDESSDVKGHNIKVSTDDATAREATFAATSNEVAKLCHTNEDVSSGKMFTADSNRVAANDGSLDVKEHEFKTSMNNATMCEVLFTAKPNEDAKGMPEKQNCNENEDLKPVAEKQFCDENEDLKPVPKNQLLIDMLKEDEPKRKPLAEVANAGAVAATDLQQTPSEWPQEFERQRSEIIQLWDACHVPLVHRTYFFLLFKGDPSDAVYMEVEFRRLCFLKNSWSRGERVVKDGQILTEATSIKALKRERDMLCKQMVRTFSASERNDMFQQWGIGLNSKQRRLQLCNKLWKNTKDVEHLKKSAALVAKLVGIIEPNAASKEMFGLSFAPQPMSLRSFSWAPRMPFIN